MSSSGDREILQQQYSTAQMTASQDDFSCEVESTTYTLREVTPRSALMVVQLLHCHLLLTAQIEAQIETVTQIYGI